MLVTTECERRQQTRLAALSLHNGRPVNVSMLKEKRLILRGHADEYMVSGAAEANKILAVIATTTQEGQVALVVDREHRASIRNEP